MKSAAVATSPSDFGYAGHGGARVLPLIVAHRGASADAPENTLAALRLGFAQGADYAECDVHLTLDGELVLMHDDTLARTAGDPRAVADLTLAELRALDVGAWRGERWRGEKITTLEEALANVPPGRRLLVEVKSGSDSMPAVAAALAASGRGAETCILMGFDAGVARAALRVLPEVERHWLVEIGAGADAAAVVRDALAAGCAALNVDRAAGADAALVKAAHDAGLGVFVWTVDNEDEARRLAALGVDGLTTNRPAAIRVALSAF